MDKQEEFIFGNAKVETSTCAWQYPVYFEGKLVGAVDIADIPVSCPALWSKRMMKEWSHVLDFADQMTYVKKFKLQYPFKDGIPILNIFQMPKNLRASDVPPQFRTERHETHHVMTDVPQDSE